IQVDLDYAEGTTPKSACHRQRDETLQTTLKKHSRVGRLGAPGEHCDAPLELAKQTIDWVARHWKDKLDFVIWTGDNSRYGVLHLNQVVSKLMAESLEGVPVIPSLGNNDVYPHNRIVADDSILPFFENIWRPWIPKAQRKTFLHGGYFETDVGKKLRVISLNTMYFIKKNKSVKSCAKAGPQSEHMRWFEDALRRAHKENVRVFIIGHVPPSPNDYRKTCFREYLRIASAYNDVISGHFFGHLNMDHFLLYDNQQFLKAGLPAYDDDDGEFHVMRNIERYVDWLRGMYESLDLPKDTQGTPAVDDSNLVAIQVSPSVLPVYYPTVRIYRYTQPDLAMDPDDTLLGYSQYYANITRWEHEHPDEPLEYHLEYSTENDYDLPNLSSQNIFKFAKYMIEGESDTMWNAYTRNMFVRTQNETFPGDEDDDDGDY
ncbi:Metallo-dependent phosphatase-like protein, partial [Fennellomyces sp. T-0311]